MSVGLGNIWRFPMKALNNGGGAFLIPYVIVLIFIGRPIYFMEMLIGQFSGRGSVKVYDFCPAMRGIGVGQLVAVGFITTYYSSFMAVTLRYLLASFKSVLPWSTCVSSYGENCIPSRDTNTSIAYSNESRASASYYFS